MALEDWIFRVCSVCAAKPKIYLKVFGFKGFLCHSDTPMKPLNMNMSAVICLCVMCVSACATSAFAADPIAPQPQIIWIERDNGDETFYNNVIQFATTPQYLKGTKLLLRLADPQSSDPSIASNFQLNLDAGLLKCIRGLSANGYTGTISLIPDFTGSQPHDWIWNPDPTVITSTAVKWMKPYYWANQANQLLAAAGCPLLISEVNLETENSGINADDTTLNPVRAYRHAVAARANASWLCEVRNDIWFYRHDRGAGLGKPGRAYGFMDRAYFRFCIFRVVQHVQGFTRHELCGRLCGGHEY